MSKRNSFIPEADTPQPPKRRGPSPQFRSAFELVKQFPRLRKSIVEGLLREGEIMNIIATTKVGKSWLALDLACSIVSGATWLGREVAQGDVLIVDNELHEETSADRVRRVTEARSIDLDPDFGLQYENLRGRLASLEEMTDYFNDLEPGRFKVIILDAWYRFLGPNTDENSNADATAMFNLLESFAKRLRCAFICIHHSTKGNQSGKGITDVGAGAGAQSRAADAHVVIRAHEEENCAVLEAALRNWAPLKPFCLRWVYPLWNLAEDLDPADILAAKPASRGGAAGSPQSLEDAVVEVVRDKQPIGQQMLIEAVQMIKRASVNKSTHAVRVAAERGSIVNIGKGGRDPKRYTLPGFVCVNAPG